MYKPFIVVCPQCGYEIKTPGIWRYVDYNQECPECESIFDVTEDVIQEEHT